MTSWSLPSWTSLGAHSPAFSIWKRPLVHLLAGRLGHLSRLVSSVLEWLVEGQQLIGCAEAYAHPLCQILYDQTAWLMVQTPMLVRE